MACNADRIVKYGISGTFSELPAFVSISRSVSLRVVCIQVIDAAPGGRPDQEERRLLPLRRQALPMTVASLAVPVIATSLAVAAAPLLRRLPARLLSLRSGARERTILSGGAKRAAWLEPPAKPRRLAAAWPVSGAEEEVWPADRSVPVALTDVAGALPTAERELVAPAGVPS